MINYTILTKGAPELHQIAEPVEKNEDVSELIDGMRALMYRARGIGLAANQIGVLKRVIVMDVQGLRISVINPTIERRKGGSRTVPEGCLSYPNSTVSMRRAKRIVLEGYDENWVPIKHKLSGWAAACAEHEVDHLNGITIMGES